MYLYIYDKYGMDDERKSSEELLSKALSIYFKEMGESLPEDLRILRTQNGKPYIYPDINIYFSISHSDNIWVCLMGNQNVGADVQWEKPAKIDKIASRYFTDVDAKYVETHGVEGFFDMWTVKEALAKFLGSTITGTMGKYSVSDGEELSKSLKIDGTTVWADLIKNNIKDAKEVSEIDAEGLHLGYVAERKERIWMRRIK